MRQVVSWSLCCALVVQAEAEMNLFFQSIDLVRGRDELAQGLGALDQQLLMKEE